MRCVQILLLVSGVFVACSTIKPETKEVKKFKTLQTDPIAIHIDEPDIRDNLQHFKIKGEIDEKTFTKFTADMALKDPTVKAYVIDIDSNGGQVGLGDEMAKMIESLDKPTYCIVDGMSWSMAFFLTQRCDVRIMTTRSTILLHGIKSESTISGNKNVFRSEADRLETLERATVSYYCAKMNISIAEILKMIDGKDVWMDSKMAIKLNAIDLATGSYSEALERAKHLWKPHKN